MSDPVVFKVARPFGSVDEYLAAEGRLMDLKHMVVVGADPLPAETLVRFGVDLQNGEAVIRAEGTVIGVLAPTGDHPGGLRIRFRRYGASTKAILERARALRAQQPKPPGEEASAPAHSAPAHSAPVNSMPDAAPVSEITQEVASLPRRAAPPLPSAGPGNLAALRDRSTREVATPPNRNDLLGRLRQRAAR